MALNIDAKFEEKLTCALTNGMANVENLNSTFSKTFYACFTELLFLRYK